MKIKEFHNIKSLILPINNKGEILIQDRRGYKKPDWGYFGGEVEERETPINAIIRETKEELDINVNENELKYIGDHVSVWNNDGNERRVLKHFYVYKTNQEKFSVLEGKGAQWLTFNEALQRLEKEDGLKEIKERIEKIDNTIFAKI